MAKEKTRQELFQQALKDVNAKMVKTKGADKIISFISDMQDFEVEKFSSGSIIVDSVLGGGFPRGRIIEISGPEASGKTSIALTAIADVQKKGGNCVFVDVEQALDIHYAQKLGVDLEKLALSQPSIAEEALTLVYEMANSGAVDLIVLDSVAALSPRAEYEEEIGKTNVAPLARLMSAALRKLISVASQNNCSIIFINQVRDNIGSFFGGTTTPGGRALKFYASQRLEVRRRKQVTADGETIGNEVFVKCIKNKVAPPYGEGTTVLTFNEGINVPAEIFEVGTQLGIIEQVGQRFYFETEEDIVKEKDDKGNDIFYDRDNKDMPGHIKIETYKKKVIEQLENDSNLLDIVADRVVKRLQEKNMGAVHDEEK